MEELLERLYKGISTGNLSAVPVVVNLQGGNAVIYRLVDQSRVQLKSESIFGLVAQPTGGYRLQLSEGSQLVIDLGVDTCAGQSSLAFVPR